ncbi:50S ribosomal protein L21 [bacterium HR34]|nr:50S ribosomal protein L21 [bacterium HR34]
MLAVIKTGGKQYLVKEGDVLQVEKIEAQEGDKIKINNVLLIAQGEENIKIGNPFVEGVYVEVVVLKHGKGEKKITFKYRPKERYKVKKGHRQPYTEIKIEKINA